MGKDKHNADRLGHQYDRPQNLLDRRVQFDKCDLTIPARSRIRGMPDISHPLPSERIRLQELSERESQFGVEWTDVIPAVVAAKIYIAFTESGTDIGMVDDLVWKIRREHRSGDSNLWNTEETLAQGRYARDVDALDCIASISLALDALADELNGVAFRSEVWNGGDGVYRFFPDIFRKRVNDAFLNYRINWIFIGGALVPRSHQDLFAEIVEPTTRFLGSDPKWGAVQRAYEKSLTELSRNDPGDAITDASTALQEMLRARGADGATLKKQVARAVSSGVLAGWDIRLTSGIASFIDWVEAERSNNGDAHHDAADADNQNAWLVIHIVGALVLRLSEQDHRREPAAASPIDAD